MLFTFIPKLNNKKINFIFLIISTLFIFSYILKSRPYTTSSSVNLKISNDSSYVNDTKYLKKIENKLLECAPDFQESAKLVYCNKNIYSKFVKEEGLSDSIKIFSTQYRNNYYGAGYHLTMHAIGDSYYYISNKDINKVFKDFLKGNTNAVPNTISQGFYHGVLEAYFKDNTKSSTKENVEKILSLCEHDIYAQCAHSIGHFLYEQEYDLNKSLSDCKNFITLEKRQFFFTCFTGVFMEKAVQEYGDNVYKIKYKDYTEICKNLNLEYKPACYMADTVNSDLENPSDPMKICSFLSGEPLYSMACVKAVSREMFFKRDLTIEKIRNLCTYEKLSKIESVTCVGVIAENARTEKSEILDEEIVLNVCSTLNFFYQTYCFELSKDKDIYSVRKSNLDFPDLSLYSIKKLILRS